ncbi:esterase/lipase family protein [Nocardia sp. NPDC020380]|uniref:esterase/lipase family protein n=1 Tax=Nocardia sp. NPDC020380 TaxID=3364309 RepID=UPI0037888377
MSLAAVLVGAIFASTATATADPGPATTPAAAALPAGTTIEPPIDCGPTAAHPNPVIVLPGGDGNTTDTDAQWATMLGALRGAGNCTLLFQGGIVNGKRWAGDIPAEAHQLAEFVAKVRQATGAEQVDIVAHSAGTVVTNDYLKVLGGAPAVHHAVFITPESRGCDGAGLLAPFGIKNPPITPVQLLTALPFLASVLGSLSPDMAVATEMAPTSDVYQAIFDGNVTQPGVRYSVIATRNDQLATPAVTCSLIDEPGVTNAVYEDLFPGADPVDHSLIRSSTQTAGWVLDQLQS